MQRVLLEPAFVLHSIAYRNTSLIVDLFTRQHGRVAVVARSARGPQSRFQGRLQSFSPLLISYSGRHELKSLSHVELYAKPYNLVGRRIMCGFYLNELLIRLLQKEEPSAALFGLYQDTVMQLEQTDQVEVLLRVFEKRLLSQLGFGLALQYEAQTREPIQDSLYYRYEIELGFVRVNDRMSAPAVFQGSSLLALENESLLTDTARQDVKRLMRQVIGHYLAGRVLKSRELF